MGLITLYLGGSFYGVDEITASLLDSHLALFETAAICHNLKEAASGAEKTWIGDPMEAYLAELGKKFIPEISDHLRIDGIPFDTDRKRMSVLVRTRHGLVLHTKGALEALLPLCSRFHAADGVRPLSGEWNSRLLQAQAAMADQGLRILAFACCEVNGR